jgi:hypothetical protein
VTKAYQNNGPRSKILKHNSNHNTKSKCWKTIYNITAVYNPGEKSIQCQTNLCLNSSLLSTGNVQFDPRFLSLIRSPDRPARSQSLYRLSYPAHSMWFEMV